MNSSKVMVIFSLSKKTVFILGNALIITGGKVSFKPPVGADFLAHWVKETTVKKNKKYFPNLFIPICCAHKITQYSQDNLLATDTILRGPPQSSKMVLPQLMIVAPVVITSSTNNQCCGG
jgi:hypothetical protein